jgi:hypothetical protein
MALQIDKTFDTGLTSSSTYARISRFTVLHEEGNNNIYVEVKFYANAQAYTDGKAFIENKTFTVPYDDNTPISFSFLYVWLKTPYKEDVDEYGVPCNRPAADSGPWDNIFVNAYDV